MLIRFNTSNFLSFNEVSEFSMIANQERRKPSHLYKGNSLSILKTGILYGANASGKSNFIKAIDFSQRVILSGIDKVDPINCHYRLKDGNELLPSTFQYEIMVEGKCYNYGFAAILKDNLIIEEWLLEISAKGEKKIFERFRDDQGTHHIEFGISLKGKAKIRFDVYREDFAKSDSTLFLNEINRKSLEGLSEAKYFQSVYKWFDHKLTVLFPQSKFKGLSFIGDDNEMAQSFNSFLSIFQTGIHGVTSEEMDLDSFELPKKMKDELSSKIVENEIIIFEFNEISYALERGDQNKYKVKKLGLEHLSDQGKAVVFDMIDESDGTQRLFDFIPALKSLASSDSVFLIDEIDRSLHSKLTYAIIELFLDISKNNQSQLVVTTHESLLLDLDLLRRDEIWFVEKNSNQSRLFSLDEFKVRNDKKINKDYLLGRYGAIPIFKSFKNLNI
ncbi:ATP-binding protein [Halosquirtibacter xylanolyticus]|uniref:AAA family ATPase n=1 Tax=Halosquirtibacter xylanolyticus TaxID=3374599 RepID=UPI003749BAFB|nr:ATP-binding protein [Prolixibacteraceae bacterium]